MDNFYHIHGTGVAAGSYIPQLPQPHQALHHHRHAVTEIPVSLASYCGPQQSIARASSNGVAFWHGTGHSNGLGPARIACPPPHHPVYPVGGQTFVPSRHPTHLNYSSGFVDTHSMGPRTDVAVPAAPPHWPGTTASTFASQHNPGVAHTNPHPFRVIFQSPVMTQHWTREALRDGRRLWQFTCAPRSLSMPKDNTKYLYVECNVISAEEYQGLVSSPERAAHSKVVSEIFDREGCATRIVGADIYRVVDWLLGLAGREPLGTDAKCTLRTQLLSPRIGGSTALSITAANPIHTRLTEYQHPRPLKTSSKAMRLLHFGVLEYALKRLVLTVDQFLISRASIGAQPLDNPDLLATVHRLIGADDQTAIFPSQTARAPISLQPIAATWTEPAHRSRPAALRPAEREVGKAQIEKSSARTTPYHTRDHTRRSSSSSSTEWSSPQRSKSSGSGSSSRSSLDIGTPPSDQELPVYPITLFGNQSIRTEPMSTKLPTNPKSQPIAIPVARPVNRQETPSAYPPGLFPASTTSTPPSSEQMGALLAHIGNIIELDRERKTAAVFLNMCGLTEVEPSTNHLPNFEDFF